MSMRRRKKTLTFLFVFNPFGYPKRPICSGQYRKLNWRHAS